MNRSCRSDSDSINNKNAMVDYNFENLIYQVEEDCDLPKELARLLQQESKLIQPYQEALEIVNLGSEDCKKEIRIGADLQADVKKRLIELLHEYVDVFAWSYQDMPGLDTDIVMHHLPLKQDCPPVK